MDEAECGKRCVWVKKQKNGVKTEESGARLSSAITFVRLSFVQDQSGEAAINKLTLFIFFSVLDRLETSGFTLLS